MERIVIADSSKEFCEQLCYVLMEKYHVSCVTDGQQALRRIMGEPVDLLILDLELAELDGISLLRQLRSAGLGISVIVMGRLLSEYAIDALVQMRADYVLRKPCKAIRVAEHAEELLSCRAAEGSQTRKKLQEALELFGVPSHLRGSAYLLSAASFMAANPTQYITKELYPSVGKAFGVDSKLVERNIRTAVCKGWEQGDKAVWERYFGAKENGEICRPQNAEFIMVLVRFLKDNL